MNYEQFHQQVFLELLRFYHNGIGVTHAAEPQDEVAVALAQETNVIVKKYFETVSVNP